MGFSLSDKDLGFEDIQKQIEILNKSSILVGIQEGETTTRESKGQREKQGGLVMAEIASQNEFGTDTIPARPFMSTSFDDNSQRISKLIERVFSNVQAGRMDANTAMNQIGSVVVDFVKLKISQIVTPPNAPFTIQQKGSSKPLIDFGQLFASIQSKIVKNDER